MKLVNNRYQQQMDFDRFPHYFLILENSKEHLRVVEEIFNECVNNIDSAFVLSDGGESLSLSKHCLFLHNFFDLDINNKKILNEINNRVLNFVSQHDFVEDFCGINELFIKINDKIVENFDFKLEYESEITYEKWLKMANFKIESQSKFMGKLMAYIKIYTSLKNTKLIIFVGLSAFLSKEELEVFLKQLEYLELKCVLVEPFQKYKIENVGRIIIDEDLCEI